MGKPLAMIAALSAALLPRDSNLLGIATIAADTETIGTEVYTCVASGPADFEFVPGADANGSATNLAAEINARTTQNITATAIAGVGVLIEHDDPGDFQLACSETLAGANNLWAAAAMSGGLGQGLDSDLPKVVGRKITVAANDVTIGMVASAFNFDIAGYIIQVRDASGNVKAWDGVAALEGTRVLTLDNSGTTDLAATDEIHVLAFAAA